MNKPSFTIASHFASKAPVVREIYDKLLRTLKRFGPIVEEPKRHQSISSTRRRSREWRLAATALS